MPNYILSIEKKKGEFEEIKWSSIDKFSELDCHKLADIDLFTTSFDDINSLKVELINNSLIPLEDSSKKICIRYKNKGAMKKLDYGLAFKKDKSFLDEINCAYYLEGNLENLPLLEKLCNHYRNSYIQGSNIAAIQGYINDKKNNVDMENEYINFIHGIIKDFVIREVYVYDASTYTYKADKNGNTILKYKSLHDLAMFLSYDKQKRLNEQAKIEEAKPIIRSNSESNEEKPKVKMKKRSEVEGQLSIFDWMNEK